MGSTLLVSIGPVQSATVRGTKPRKLFRGVQRTLIRKTLAKLTSIANADKRAYARGLLLNFDAATVMGADNSADGKAFNRAMQRLRDCLDAKEGDE